MPGFYLSNAPHSGEAPIHNHDDRRCVRAQAKVDGWDVQRDTLNRFLDDKAWYEDDAMFLVAEGVILNKTELFERYGASSVPELVRVMVASDPHFFREFRGSFSGALFDKRTRKWVVWTNHYGDNTVFYACAGGWVFVGSQVDYVLEGMRRAGLAPTPNDRAVLCMLTYAFMDDCSTYATEVRRLTAGKCLEIDAGGVTELAYWELRRNRLDLSGKSEAELLDGWDAVFRMAVGREYGKDREYGKRHLIELSGGLDSRMTTWVSHEMGYRDTVNINFCQSGYTDEIVAKEIARDLRNELLLEPMDDASFLLELDDLVSMNFGLSLYSGVSGGKRILDNLNMDSFGLLHTGALGDVVLGCFLQSPDQLRDARVGGLYSSILEDEVDAVSSRSAYPDKETYLFYTRGFLGACSSHFFKRNYTDVAAPFLDVDVLEYALSIPVEVRARHRLYRRWLIERYPKAASYVWEKEGVPINCSPAQRFASKAVKKVGHIVRSIGSSEERLTTGMNPLDLWLSSDRRIADFFAGAYREKIENTALSERARGWARKVYEEGTAIEKTQVLTALAAMELYFGRSHEA